MAEKKTVVVAITGEGDGEFIVGVLRAMFGCDNPANVTQLFPDCDDPAELLGRAARNSQALADFIDPECTRIWEIWSHEEMRDDDESLRKAVLAMRGEREDSDV